MNGKITLQFYIDDLNLQNSQQIHQKNQNITLVTKITDTGKGIEEDRVNYLFTLFGELRKKQAFEKV